MFGQCVMRGCWIAVALLAASVNSAWACPMCKMALEEDDPQPRAYMISILFMMGTIFTLFGAVGALAWWVTRAERRRLEAAGYGHLFQNGVQEPMSGRIAPEVG